MKKKRNWNLIIGLAITLFFLAGAVIGYVNAGSYADLKIWSTVSLAFGIVFIAGTLIAARKNG